MIRLPQDNRWVQTNRSDLLGNLWSTFNIDLQRNVGNIRVSPRMKLNTTGLNSVPVAIKRYEDRIFCIAGTTIYRNTDTSGLPSDAFVADTSTSSGTDHSADTADLEVAFARLFATAQTKIRYLDQATGGTWVDLATINTGYNHKMVYFKKFDRLYFLDAAVKSVNSALTVATSGDYTLANIDERYSDMKVTRNYIWLSITPAPDANQGSFLTQAIIRQWDGISPQVTAEYKLPCKAVAAIVIDQERDTPYAIGSDGVFYGFNGSGFEEVGRFPYTDHLPYNAVSGSNDRFVHPNGVIQTQDGRFLFNINGLNGNNSATQNENFPSGIWEYSKENGLVHKNAFTYDPISTSITDYGQGRVSRAGALALMNVYSTASGRDGTLLAGASYYSDATTVAHGIFYDNSINTIEKYGYFVTTKIWAPYIEDVWHRITHRIKRLPTSGNKTVLKYRNTEADPTEATITWTSTTTCTTTTDVSAYNGFEMEVLNGKGGGKCSKITNIVNNAGTYTITLKETFTGASSGTAKARFQKWIEIDSITSQSLDYSSISSKIQSPWIQLKVCMQFTGVGELRDIIIDNVSTVDSIRQQ